MAEYYKDLVPGFRVSCKYNEWLIQKNEDPYGNPMPDTKYQHKGMDFANNAGTAIPAAADGTVYGFEYEAGGYGHYVILEHKDRNDKKVYTIYAQMQGATPLTKGQTVNKNQTVGYVGETGNATGPHAHFEIRLDSFKGKTVDPATYDLSQLKSSNSNLAQSNPNQSDSTGNASEQANSGEDEPAIELCSTPTACTEEELIIEIVGKVTDENQRILIYTEENQYDKARTGKRKKPEELQNGVYQSTLHKWDWKAAEKAHLWLEIAAASGDPIRLPLLVGYDPIKTNSGEIITSTSDTRKAKLTPRQGPIHRQLNLIVPFVPMTDLLSYKNLKEKVITNLKTTDPVLCCKGWVYIFRNNQLWREVEIRQNETTGKTTYHDVRLSDHRTKDPNLIDAKADIRPAVGKPLDDIWLPARWNNVMETWSMFYAPSQLSEGRVNHLQKNPKILKKRSHEVLMNLYPLPYGTSTSTQFPSMPFLLTWGADKGRTITNHIPRDLGREYLLTNPKKYLTNANYLETAKNASHILHNYFGNTTVEEDGTPIYQPESVISKEDISPAGWAYYIKESMAKKTNAVLATEEQKKDANSAWSKYLSRKEDEEILWTPDSTQSVLTPIIDKRICGIYLFDPLNQLEHTHHLIGQCRELQSLIVDQANLRKNYGSAFLIKSIMLEIGAVDDGDIRYKAATRILKDRKATTRYDYAIAHKDRFYVRSLINLYQVYHANLLQNEQTIEAIKDTTSGIGLDLLGGKANLACLLNDLNSPAASDPLSTPSELKKEISWPNLANTLTDPKNPYYNMLFPPKVDLSSMLYPYQNQPIEEVTTKGDGTWNPGGLGLLEPVTNDRLKILVQLKESIGTATETLTLPQIEDLQGVGLNTIHGKYMAERALVSVDETTLIASKVLSTIAAYISNIDNLIKNSIEQAMKSADADAKLAQDGQTYYKEEINQANKEQATRNQRIQELDSSIATNKAQQAEISNKLDNARGREQTLRGKLQTAQEAVVKEQGRLDQLDRANYLNIPDEQIKGWTEQDIAGNADKAELRTIVRDKLQHIAEQDKLWNRGTELSQELEGIKSQQQTVSTEIDNTRVERNQRSQQALSELQRQRPTVTALASTFSVESMRQISYSGFFELDLVTEVTPDSAKLPIGIDKSIFTQLGQPSSKRRYIFSHAEASLVEYDAQGNKIAEVGWDGKVNQEFIKRHSGGNFKIRVVGYFFTANRKKSSWKDNKASLDDIDNKVDDLKRQYDSLQGRKGPLLEELSETERQQLAAMEAEAKAAEEQIAKVDEMYAKDLAQQQTRVENSQQAVYDNERKITNCENRIQELEGKQELSQTEAKTLANERATLEAEQAKTAQLIADHQQAQAEQKRLEGEYHKEQASLQQELNKITNNHIGTNSLLYKLANSNSRLASLAGLAAQRTKVTLYGLLDNPLVPAVILVLEGRNLIHFYTSLSEQRKRYGNVRYTLELFSVTLSTAAALEGFASKFAWNKVAYEAWANKALKEAPKILQKIGLKAITWRLLFQGPATVLAIGQSLWNIWDDIFKYQDWGSLAGNTILLGAAVAGIPATIASITGGTVATISSGGWFLIILGLVAVGVYVKSVFSRNELEKWTDFGPFTDKPRYNLQDETYAFHTLSTLLANVSANFEEITEQQINELEWKVLTNGATRPKQLMRLTITSSLADLLDKKSSKAVGGVQAEIMGEKNFAYTPKHYFEQKIPGGVARYYDLSQDIDSIHTIYTSYYRDRVGTIFGIQAFYKLAAQVLVQDKDHKLWAHPSIPDIYNPSFFNISKDGVPPENRRGDENKEKKYWLQENSKYFQVGDLGDMFTPTQPFGGIGALEA